MMKGAVIRPHEVTGHVYVFDDIGLLAKVTVEHAKSAYKQGHVKPTDEPCIVRLVEQPIRQMTPEEKRQRELDRQKALQERRGRRGRRR